MCASSFDELSPTAHQPKMITQAIKQCFIQDFLLGRKGGGGGGGGGQKWKFANYFPRNCSLQLPLFLKLIAHF